MLIWTFWLSVAAVVVVTIGYPLFLLLSAPIARGRTVDDDLEPAVLLVIAAYNEQSVIAAKLENALALNYPREKLSIVVASDGSSDRTNSIVESYAGRGIALAAFPRTGKTGVQNRMAERATAEVLVFSDANAMYRPDAIRKLVRNFADPGVGAVCGQLTYEVAGTGAGSSESAYWDYEKFMKRRESELSSVVGANGSIYAVRRSDYVAIDEDMISDLVEPLAIVRSGKRVVYEPDAVSVEAGSNTYAAEFRRKVRILTRAIRGVLRMRALLNPFKFGVFSVQLAMHKLLRFITPLFLVSGTMALVLLAVLGHYRPLLVAAILVVAMSVAVAARSSPRAGGALLRALHLVYYYLVANCALVFAWINIVRGQRMTIWVPERTGP